MLDPLEKKIRKLVELNEGVTMLENKMKEKKSTKKYLKKECSSCQSLIYLSE